MIRSTRPATRTPLSYWIDSRAGASASGLHGLPDEQRSIQRLDENQDFGKTIDLRTIARISFSIGAEIQRREPATRALQSVLTVDSVCPVLPRSCVFPSRTGLSGDWIYDHG